MSPRAAGLRWLAPLILVAIYVAGCASVPRSSGRAPADSAAQSARSQALSARNHWRLAGRVAIRANGDGGSGRIDWQQSPQGSSFDLRSPIGGQSWRLETAPGEVRLLGLESGELRGSDPRQLLREAIGWDLPFEQLQWWVRGLPAPGTYRLQPDSDGLPQRLQQAGWRIEYQRWVEVDGQYLPSKLFAERDDRHLRLLISQWSFD